MKQKSNVMQSFREAERKSLRPSNLNMEYYTSDNRGATPWPDNNKNPAEDNVYTPYNNNQASVGESIVVSGGHYEGESRYDYIFIEPALRQISDLSADGVENITWLIDGTDYSNEDIMNFLKDGYANGADKVVIIEDEANFKNYIETGNMYETGRRPIPITQFYLFSHGTPGQIILEKNSQGKAI